MELYLRGQQKDQTLKNYQGLFELKLILPLHNHLCMQQNIQPQKEFLEELLMCISPKDLDVVIDHEMFPVLYLCQNLHR